MSRWIAPWLTIVVAMLVATDAVGFMVPVRRQAAPVRGPSLAFRDMEGREIVLAAPPRRIVSLVPSATEMIYALGGQDRLVGRTDFCDYPPAAKEKTSVGGMISPSLETLVALRPDLVLGTTSGNQHETFKQIERLKIPVYLVGADRIADVKEVARRLGALTGREAAVAPLLDRIDRRVAAVRDAVKSHGRPRVLYVLWPDPLIVPGRRALVTELIEIAGGDSITAADAEAYPRYSLEAAVAKSPDIVVLANHGTRSGPIAVDRWQRLTSLPALKNGRVHSVEGNLMHRYGPRMLDGLDQLARAIHPEAFR